MTLALMCDGERLTALEALRRFGCLRLGARIWELKHQCNMEALIITEPVKLPGGKIVTGYRIADGNGIEAARRYRANRGRRGAYALAAAMEKIGTKRLGVLAESICAETGSVKKAGVL